MTMTQRCILLASAAIATLLAPTCTPAALDVLDAYYRPDQGLPQFNYLWNSSYRPGNTPPNYILSGGLVVYLRNAGSSPETLDDVLLQGISLKAAFGCKTNKTYRDGLAYACSIHIPSGTPISTAQRQTLIDAGEPVWWRMEPATLYPGETAEVFVRMRVRYDLTLSVAVKTAAGASIPLSIAVSSTQPPRVAGFALSPSLNRLTLYFRHPQKGKAPSQVLLDGQDITASAALGSDPAIDVVAAVCTLAAPLARGSYHTFQAIYDDGTKASAGARVFHDDLDYGLWGGNNASTLAEGRAHVENMGRHCFNEQVQGATGMVNDFMKSAEGLALMAQLEMYRTNADPDKGFGRLSSIYLCDEPDAGDAAVPVTAVPSYAQLGSLSQSLVVRAQTLHAGWPSNANLLNLDSTFKPHNWYTYGQVPDIFAADPYYQTRLADSYWSKPHQIPLYAKATYIHAVASVCRAACEPKPLHLILSCTRRQDGSRVFRWGTPEEKRIEVYYALAGGAKQFSYWWFTGSSPTTSGSSGPGREEPGSAALWREMGLLGAEARTAGPVIVRSCPASVPATAPGNLWVRTLIAGLDTLLVLCVNDDYANDLAGTILRPVENAEVTVDLPAWMGGAQVFEINYRGTHDVSSERVGQKLTLDLGTVNVTRMIAVTTDTTLRAATQSLYQTKFAPRVSQIIPPG